MTTQITIPGHKKSVNDKNVYKGGIKDGTDSDILVIEATRIFDYS